MSFSKAKKENIKLKMGVFGPSGSGKTYSSLSIATGMGDKIALIDSEHGSSRRLADQFDFDVCCVGGNFSVDEYIQKIMGADRFGYDVLILDSITHVWEVLVSKVDSLAESRYGGNTMAAWSKGTQVQNRFVDAIKSCNCHVIATMRSKTEWVIDKDDRGKTRIQKLGLTPKQRSGIEYEFDLLMELSQNHVGTISKDRSGSFQGLVVDRPNKDFGEKLLDWCVTKKKSSEALVEDSELVGGDDLIVKKISDIFGGVGVDLND